MSNDKEEELLKKIDMKKMPVNDKIILEYVMMESFSQRRLAKKYKKSIQEIRILTEDTYYKRHMNYWKDKSKEICRDANELRTIVRDFIAKKLCYKRFASVINNKERKRKCLTAMEERSNKTPT